MQKIFRIESKEKKNKNIITNKDLLRISIYLIGGYFGFSNANENCE
jgi:hypothetical protein